MIIEKMEMPFWGLVDTVIADSGNAKQVDLTLLAQQLIRHVQTVHKKNHIIMDLKPDNLMFAKRASKKSTLADRLRFIDLGLWKHLSKNDPDKVNGLTGNAMYCSLSMQEMNYPATKDDLQMAIIVIAEMAIRVQAALNGDTDKYEKSNTPSYLPWGTCQNEQATFQCKRENLTQPNSELYKRMPPKCADKIYRLIGITREMSFPKKADYEAIIDDLKSFVIPKPTKRKSVSRTKPVPKSAQSAKQPAGGRTTRAAVRRSRSPPVEEEEDAKPSPRKRSATTRNAVVDLVESDDSEDESSGDPMEVELLDSNGVVMDMQKNMENRKHNNMACAAKTKTETMAMTQSLRVTIKQGRSVLYSFDANPEESFVLTSTNSSSRSTKVPRYEIPAGHANHCLVKVVGVKPKPGTRVYDKILAVEVQHTAKTGSTLFGDITLDSSNKKKSLTQTKIYRGRVGAESKITIGDVIVTFEKLY